MILRQCIKIATEISNVVPFYKTGEYRYLLRLTLCGRYLFFM